MANYGNGKRVEHPMELLDCYIGRGSWRNFTGEKSQYNSEGDYDFTVFLPEELFYEMEEEGWYVKHKEQYAGDKREYQINVAFSFDNYPPKITMVSADGSSAVLTKDTVALLQNADIERADIIIRPYNWTNKRGESGCKAYLNSMTAWIRKPVRSANAAFSEEDEEEVADD